MTLLFCDQPSGMATADLATFYDIHVNLEIGFGEGRRGGDCFKGTVNEYILKRFSDYSSGSWFVGGAFKFGAFGGSSFINIFNDDREQLRLYVTAAGLLALHTNNGYRAYSTNIIAKNNWYYIEIEGFCDAAAGVFTVKVDGVQWATFSGDTLYGGTALLRSVKFLVNNTYLYFCDLYVCDDQGSYNNTFLGECRVDTVYPNGAGNYTNLTPSAGNNFECVDEDPLSIADYVEGDTNGEEDSYTFADVPTDLDDSNIYGIQLGNVAQRNEPQATVTHRSFVRTGAADYFNLAQTPIDNWDSFHDCEDRDPSDSGAWTKAKINACEFGIDTVM